MKRFDLFLSLTLAVLIVLHLLYRIDFADLYHPANKGGATGVMICVLGLFSLWLSHRAGEGEKDVT
ncbi:MAG TPA: hypothetical protein VJ876_04550 [Bacteroidales bacterium]|nr:hypothetical protein [Bacteroidales bacterium]